MRASIPLLVFIGGLLAASPGVAAETPAELVRAAKACGSDRSCLAAYVADPIYFPEARDLAKASPECASAVEAARHRDAHGWYLGAEAFVACVLSATEAFPGTDILPRAALEQCFSDSLLEHAFSRDTARLLGSDFMCELERRPGGWVLTRLVLQP